MGMWTNKDHRTVMNDAEDLACPSAGGPWTKWFGGCVVPLVIMIYSIVCLWRGSTTLPGRRSSGMEITGTDGVILAIAYLALGAFAHFHCFWGLHGRLANYSQALKGVSLLIFLPCLCLVVWHQIHIL